MNLVYIDHQMEQINKLEMLTGLTLDKLVELFAAGYTLQPPKVSKSLEELQQKGLLIELPCKVGDTVWDIKWWDYYDESVVVDGKTYHRQVCKYKVTKSRFSLMDYNRIGEDVFLTKKEAEEACKKKNGKD